MIYLTVAIEVLIVSVVLWGIVRVVIDEWRVHKWWKEETRKISQSDSAWRP